MKTFKDLKFFDKVYLQWETATSLSQPEIINFLSIDNSHNVTIRVNRESFIIKKEDINTSIISKGDGRYTLYLNRKDAIEQIKINIEKAIENLRRSIQDKQEQINKYTQDLLDYLSTKELEENQ